jgi:hypothetical protein
VTGSSCPGKGQELPPYHPLSKCGRDRLAHCRDERACRSLRQSTDRTRSEGLLGASRLVLSNTQRGIASPDVVERSVDTE